MRFLCSLCQKEYPVETREFRCSCGGPFDLAWVPGGLSVSSLRDREPTLWRYREWIPVLEEDCIVSLREGFTPLVRYSYKGFRRLFLKLDYLCPTGSYKDRGASVLVSKLKELGIRRCVADSSGNAGAAIAAYAARAKIECTVYCPAHTSEGKLVQIRAYGAHLVKVPGTRADTAKAVQEETRRLYYASHNWNPFFLAGMKTLAFELGEQMGWQVPDAAVCPVGYGGIYLGLYLGFKELLNQGILKKMPRLIGVQSEAVSPLYQAFSREAIDVAPVPSRETLAEGIACVHPIRGRKILEIARETGGTFQIVSEEEILDGWRSLAQEGIYVEPTSAVVIKAIDGLEKKGLLNHDETIVLILTGIGLKATDTLGQYLRAV